MSAVASVTKESGLFFDYYLKIKNASSESDLDGIAKCASDLERMVFIDNLQNVRENDVPIERVVGGGKRAADSAKFKESGNEAFKLKNWMGAVNLYSKSYIAAPAENSADIALALANRSAALYHLKNYPEALLDISRALSLDYPKDLIYKLFERQARCYLAQNDYQNSIQAFKETVSALDKSKLPAEKRDKSIRDAMVMIQMLERDLEINKKKQSAQRAAKKPIECRDTEFLSDSIRIDCNEEEGRHAKAKRDIQIGEGILIERPFVAALLEKFAKTHCESCLKRLSIPYACPQCVDVLFCSEKCYKTAAESFHKYECGVLPNIRQSHVSINCHLALRIIASKPVEYFLNLRPELDKELTTDQLQKLKKDDYRRVSSLVAHTDKRNGSNFYQHALMARFLTNCLQGAGYFKQASKDDVLFISSLILRNLQFIQFNTHEISELVTGADGEATEFIGGGIYPNLALFNHSCNPSIVRYFRGSTIIVNAITELQIGESVSENYGPIYTQTGREERREKLKEQYWFECNCDACINNWPKYEEMKQDVIRFKCESEQSCTNVIEIPANCMEFMITCTACGHVTNILKGLKLMQDVDMMNRTAKRLYDSGDYPKAAKKYIEVLKIMSQVLAPPFTDYCQAQQNIKDCFLHFGNSYKSL